MMKQTVSDTPVMLSKFTLATATAEHGPDIRDLVNLTYRGESGWTRETHIIGGDRTNLDEITDAMARPDARFFVVYLNNRLAACIYLAREACHAYIGFFSVHPDYQGQGVGNYILQQTESIAKTQLATDRIRMYVVSQRPELIAFYQRRGYRQFGEKQVYPLQLKIGVPKVANLTIEYLEKCI